MTQLIRISNMNLHERYKHEYEQGKIKDYLPEEWSKATDIFQADFWLFYMEQLNKHGIQKYIPNDKKSHDILKSCISQWCAEGQTYRYDTEQTYLLALTVLGQFYDVELIFLQHMFNQPSLRELTYESAS